MANHFQRHFHLYIYFCQISSTYAAANYITGHPISENKIKKYDDVYSFGEIIYFILSGNEIDNSEKESVLESFPLLAQQLIEACFYEDRESRPTFEMICDILKQNNFDLLSLTQQEMEDVSNLISQYYQ